jgi:DNA repair ATPase RecN
MEEITERKNDLLNIDDEDDESVIFDIKNELKEGKLTPKGKEKLQNLCEDWEEEIDSFGRDARYNRYLPILSAFDINASDTLEKLQRTGDYEEIVKSYKDKIQEILKKSSEGTLQESDLDDLENQIDDYYKFEKSLTTSALNLSESRDQNGDIVASWTSTFYKSGETFVRGIKAVGKGDWIKGGALVAGSVVSLDIITYPIRRGAGIIGHGKV